MSFRFPTPADLRSIGSTLGLDLGDDDAKAMCDSMTPLMQGFDFLDRESDELPELKYPERPYKFPQPADNPLNGWYVKTSIRGAPIGPLAGRTVAVKDVIFVAGVPMMNGASILDGFVPDFDAPVVTRLLDAGAEIAGKAACEYLCVSGASCTASCGIVENPRKSGYSSGGSSSGSAALVGGGHVEMALGTDQAGSVRAPSSWSGTCGMKPTFGLVPYTGAMGQEACIDHIGPMTSNVADNALMLEVIAGYDGYDGRQQNLVIHEYTDALGVGVKGMKIGVVDEGFGRPDSEPDVDACVRAAATRFRTLGARVVEVSIPQHPYGLAVWTGILGDGLWQTLKFNGLGYNYRGVYSPAQWRAMEGWIGRLGETTANVRLLVMMGAYLERFHGRYYAKAKNLGRRLRAAYDAALQECDLLLMPTTRYKARPNPRTLVGMTDQELFKHIFVGIENNCPFDVTGHPAMSIPCGLREGLPIGMMLIAKHFDEPAIYRAAHAFEQSGRWEQM
ncbi:MAG: amidase [Gammaproteobacteria bacterium]